MNHKSRVVLRFFVALFTLSVSLAVLSCGLILAHGLFGEIKTGTVTQESRTGREELSACRPEVSAVKGENRYNIWFEIAPVLICLAYLGYRFRLPGRETIVTLKVRMDN